MQTLMLSETRREVYLKVNLARSRSGETVSHSASHDVCGGLERYLEDLAAGDRPGGSASDLTDCRSDPARQIHDSRPPSKRTRSSWSSILD